MTAIIHGQKEGVYWVVPPFCVRTNREFVSFEPLTTELNKLYTTSCVCVCVCGVVGGQPGPTAMVSGSSLSLSLFIERCSKRTGDRWATGDRACITSKRETHIWTP